MSQLGDTSQRWCFGGAQSGSLELDPYGTLDEAVPHDKGILEMRVCFDPLCNDFRRVEVLWCPPGPIGGVQNKTGKPFHVYKLKPSPNPLAETGAGFGYCAERLHAEWQEWGEWSLCSKTCQETNGQAGTQTRRAGCTEGLTGGRTCDELIRIQPWNERGTRTCNEVCCPRNGEFRAWSSWGACSKSCSSKGGSAGEQRRTRTCTPASCGGQPCAAADLLQKRDCNGFDTAPCPIDGNWSDWGSWTTCVAGADPCHGKASMTRSCNNPAPQYGGVTCSGTPIRKKSCEIQDCPVDCICNEFSKVWTPCSQSCTPAGGSHGKQTNKRICVEGVHGGKTCKQKYEIELGQPLTRTRECNTEACPVDCICQEFNDTWSSCSKSCTPEGGISGVQTSERVCIEGSNGGKTCKQKYEIDLKQPLTRTRECNTLCCPIDGNFVF